MKKKLRIITKIDVKGLNVVKDIHSDGMTCVGTEEMGDAVVKTLSALLV